MYRARTTRSTLSANSSSCRRSASGLRSAVTGMWMNGTANGRTGSARSGWLEITIGIVMWSSPTPAAPEQVEQAVVLLGHHDRDALGPRGVGQPDVHAHRLRDTLEELGLQRVAAGGQAGQVELHALAERAAADRRRVLIQGDDVRPVLREEPADRCDDAGSVRAADQQPADLAT